MGVTRADLVRLLPAITPPDTLRWMGALVAIRRTDVALDIHLGAERERRIGALRMPSIRLEFRHLSGSAGAFAAFLERFDRAFHKGGG
jgi:hypothetical protein